MIEDVSPIPRHSLHKVQTYLEVYDHCKNEHCGQQVHQVRQILAVECLTKGAHFVIASGQQVEEGDDGALKLRASTRVHSGRREGLPDDGLANVGGNEQGNSRTESIAFLNCDDSISK